jgi:hypothetical protein
MTEETQQDAEAGIPEDGQQTPPIGMADESQPQAGGETADAAQPSPTVAPPKGAASRIIFFGLAAAVLGILAGIAFADIVLRPPGRSGIYDLGTALFTADGLKGHLVLNWEKQVVYHLVVEPSEPARQAEFSLAVSSPPRPLSVLFQVKDSAGYVVCFKSIVLKYDPRQAAVIAASGSAHQPGTAASDAEDQAEMARFEARELDREKGQDVFHKDAGQDGQTKSITAQGAIPCSRQAYDQAASWSFSPDFPSLEEQADWLKHEQDLRAVASASAAETPNVQGTSVRQRMARKKAQEEAATTYAIEGDDELVGFDPARGIVRTSTGETFVVVKAAAADNAARWQELPATIHFKCDLNGICALSRRDASVLYARLSR